MTSATTEDLVTYLAGLVERLDRFGVTILPPNDAEEVALGQEPDGSLVIDLATHLPGARRSAEVALDLFERWKLVGRNAFERSTYRYELRHRGLDYRRAFHRHDVDHFVRTFDVATHEHCESPMGHAICGHSFGLPISDGFDAFDRLFDLWLTDAPPDCSTLRCLA